VLGLNAFFHYIVFYCDNVYRQNAKVGDSSDRSMLVVDRMSCAKQRR